MFLSTATLDCGRVIGRVQQKGRRLRARQEPDWGSCRLFSRVSYFLGLGQPPHFPVLTLKLPHVMGGRQSAIRSFEPSRYGDHSCATTGAGVCQTVLSWPSAWISPM